MSNKKNLVPELRFPEFITEMGWDYDELGEIAEIVRGGSPRPIQEFLTTDNNGLNWLKIADVPSEAKYITETKEKVIQKALNSTRVVNSGDLILSNSMSFGRPYILRIKTCIHDGWIAIRKISDKTFEDYLYYFISSEISQKYFHVNAAGAAVKNLNAEIIKLLPVYLPKSKEEQQKIVDFLSSLDELIDSYNDKLEALNNYKKGLLQNLFPKKGEKIPSLRFPEFEEDGEWVKKNFQELFEIGNGRDYKHLNEGNVPVYGSGGYMLSVDEFLYEGESACIGRKGTIDKPIFLTGKFWTVDTLFYTHSFNKCIPKFIYYIFQNIKWLRHNQASGVPSLSKTNIYKIETMIPKPDEQLKIVNFLTGLDELITTLEEKIEQLQQHKKGLMQGLFPNLND